MNTEDPKIITVEAPGKDAEEEARIIGIQVVNPSLYSSIRFVLDGEEDNIAQ